MSSRVIPTLRYRDALRMIDWLCEVFGFARHALAEGSVGRRARASHPGQLHRIRCENTPAATPCARQLRYPLMEMVGAARFELATPCSRSKCATRLRYAPPDRGRANLHSMRWRSSRQRFRLIAAAPRGRKPRGPRCVTKIAGDGSSDYVPCRSALGAGKWGVAKR
jgi:hypothetical protein